MTTFTNADLIELTIETLQEVHPDVEVISAMMNVQQFNILEFRFMPRGGVVVREASFDRTEIINRPFREFIRLVKERFGP